MSLKYTTSNIIEENTPVLEKAEKILIVDDCDSNILIAGTYLENFGYEYDVSFDGFDALDRIKKAPYFAILMDIQMPQMDGIETAMRIRAFENENDRMLSPIIAMTAQILSSDYNSCMAAGMNNYLLKPINHHELKTILHNFAAKVI